MISLESTYLDRLDALLNNIRFDLYSETFGKVYLTFLIRKPDWLQISQALEEYERTGLPDILKELVKFPVTALRREILKNLSFFDRKSQEDAYTKMLIDLPYTIGIHNGLISLYEECTQSLIQFLPEQYSHLRLLLNCNDDVNSIAFILQNILDATNVFEGAERSDIESQPTQPGVKLKWNCKPAVAGYIIAELIRAGYIEPPTTNGELSYAKLAGICNRIFDIQSDGKPTTLDYLKKVVNPESNPLPDFKRAKLKLPDLDQLT